MIKSQCASMVVPTPIAARFTAAINGLFRVDNAVRKGEAADVFRFPARCWKSLMSLPEVNVFSGADQHDDADRGIVLGRIETCGRRTLFVHGAGEGVLFLSGRLKRISITRGRRSVTDQFFGHARLPVHGWQSRRTSGRGEQGLKTVREIAKIFGTFLSDGGDASRGQHAYFFRLQPGPLASPMRFRQRFEIAFFDRDFSSDLGPNPGPWEAQSGECPGLQFLPCVFRDKHGLSEERLFDFFIQFKRDGSCFHRDRTQKMKHSRSVGYRATISRRRFVLSGIVDTPHPRIEANRDFGLRPPDAGEQTLE